MLHGAKLDHLLYGVSAFFLFSRKLLKFIGIIGVSLKIQLLLTFSVRVSMAGRSGARGSAGGGSSKTCQFKLVLLGESAVGLFFTSSFFLFILISLSTEMYRSLFSCCVMLCLSPLKHRSKH